MSLSPRNHVSLITSQSASLPKSSFAKPPLTNSNSFDGSFNSNTTNKSDQPPKMMVRKTPVKTFSLTRGIPRSGSTDSMLPTYNGEMRSFHSDQEDNVKSPYSTPRKPERYQDTENGHIGSLSSSASYCRDRSTSYDNTSESFYSADQTKMSKSKTFGESISQVWNGTMSGGKKKKETLPLHHSSQEYRYDEARNGSSTAHNNTNTNTPSLRSRRARSVTTDRDDISVEECNNIDRRLSPSPRKGRWSPWSSSNGGSDPATRLTFSKGGKRRSSESQEFLLPMRIAPPVCPSSKRFNFIYYSKRLFQCNWIQVLIIFVGTGVIWHSYHRTQAIHSRLEKFHDKESMSLLHLKTVEQQLVHLHENIVRLNNAATNNVVANDHNSDGSNHGSVSKKDAVDAELIREQTQRLQQMEEELDHELRALQTKIQHVARSSIVDTFGEGPVQIVLELDFTDPDIRDVLPPGSNPNHNTISILLWYDVPHAAWTWIHQIREGMWNNASFKLGKGSLSVDAMPNVRHHPKTDNSDLNEFGTGMFINLQDNSALRNHDVCVGKVIDGFDALQLLVDISRRLEGSSKSVTIKTVIGSHLTRGQTQGVM
jgi:hypothetical protein